jgi:hypothetical protein
MAEVTSIDPRTDPEFDELLSKWKQEHQPKFDPEALACLTLVPTWTPMLADRCKFKHAGSWDEFLATPDAAKLVQREQGDVAIVPQAPALWHFWMIESARPAAAQQLINQHGRGFLASWAKRLGEMIIASQHDDPAVPAITRWWAELARDLDRGSDQQTIGLPQKVGSSRTFQFGDTGQAALTLSRRVTELIDKGEMGEARRWIEAAQVLATALGGPLEDYILLAKRRVELTYRQELDRRYLMRFVEPKAQHAAFHELMTGPDAFWALHYLGMGGMGKTMLLRHIGDLASREYRAPVARIDFDYLSPNYPVRHPGQLLLALAEDLRRQFTDPEHQKAYEALHDSLDYLHEVIGGEPPAADPLANLHRREFDEALGLFAALLESLLRTAVATSVPKALPTRVVLVLDTCEELVKLQFGEGSLPHLAATFEIIERVHSRVPRVRVILAGRRLLTLGGVGWRAVADRLPQAKSYLLPVKPYLRLHLIRGFKGDEDEAGELFKRFETATRSLPQEIRDAILTISEEHGTPAALQADDGRRFLLPENLYRGLLTVLSSSAARDRMNQLADDPRFGLGFRSLLGSNPSTIINDLLEETAPDGSNLLELLLRELFGGNRSSEQNALAAELKELLTRYSPFSLSLYSKWYLDEPKLTPERIQTGGDDPYVELRIDRRISQTDPVRQLLPAVLLMRRFNADMLAPVFTGNPADFRAAFDALSDHEWINYRGDPETNTTWLEVDANLYPRLRIYWEKTYPTDLATARRVLSLKLVERVHTPPLHSLPAETIAAAIALLPDAEAVQVWSEVEWRVPMEADWNWGLKVARFALGAEADFSETPRPLVHAALSATVAAANIQLSALYDSTPAWRQVADTVAQLTAEESAAPLARWLAARAHLGSAAAARLQGHWPAAAELSSVGTVLDERESSDPAGLNRDQIAQLDAGLLAALEAILDAVEGAGYSSPLPEPSKLDLWANTTIDTRHRVFVILLQGRALSLLGLGDAAREALESAETLADKAAEETWVPSRWADWRAPTSLRHRVRLEWLRLRPDLPVGPEETSTRQLGRWLSGLANSDALSQIDGERLASATLGRLLDSGPVDLGLLADLAGPYRYILERQPTCLAHRQTPPLFLALARGLLAIGEIARAEKLLLEFEREATKTAADALTVADSQRGLIDLARRTRDSQRGRHLLAGQATLNWPEPNAWAMGALTGTLTTDEVPVPTEAWDNTRLHAWWRAQHSLTSVRLEQASVLAARAAMQDEPSAATWPDSMTHHDLEERAWLILDACERALVAGDNDSVTPKSINLLMSGSQRNVVERPAEVQRILRLLLRWIALNLSPNVHMR